jgi:hypothetical protein
MAIKMKAVTTGNISVQGESANVKLKAPIQTITQADHANLTNLDYENSGHTGFQPAGDYALKKDIPDVSNFITKEVSDLTNYYNKDSIDEMIGDIEALLSEV